MSTRTAKAITTASEERIIQGVTATLRPTIEKAATLAARDAVESTLRAGNISSAGQKSAETECGLSNIARVGTRLTDAAPTPMLPGLTNRLFDLRNRIGDASGNLRNATDRVTGVPAPFPEPPKHPSVESESHAGRLIDLANSLEWLVESLDLLNKHLNAFV